MIETLLNPATWIWVAIAACVVAAVSILAFSYTGGRSEIARVASLVGLFAATASVCVGLTLSSIAAVEIKSNFIEGAR